MKHQYHEYNNLSLREKDNLVQTNYYRFKHKLPLIEVPEDDTVFWKKFNKLIKDETNGRPNIR